MNILRYNAAIIFLFVMAASCNNNTTQSATVSTESISTQKGMYAYDAAFLKKHTLKVLEAAITKRKIMAALYRKIFIR